MAKVLSSISVTVSADDNGNLILTNTRAQYAVKDSVSSDLRKGGNLILDDLVTTDTLAAWWTKVQDKVKAAEGI